MWFLYALLASVFWGMNYSLYEHVMRKLSLGAVFGGMAAFNLILATGFYLADNKLRQDGVLLRTDPSTLKLFSAMLVVGSLASVLIVMSIRGRNATMAAMIEIAYPLFTALFAWLFFRETQANMGTLVGAMLILSGVSCIYFYGKNI